MFVARSVTSGAKLVTTLGVGLYQDPPGQAVWRPTPTGGEPGHRTCQGAGLYSSMLITQWIACPTWHHFGRIGLTMSHQTSRWTEDETA